MSRPRDDRKTGAETSARAVERPPAAGGCCGGGPAPRRVAATRAGKVAGIRVGGCKPEDVPR